MGHESREIERLNKQIKVLEEERRVLEARGQSYREALKGTQEEKEKILKQCAENIKRKDEALQAAKEAIEALKQPPSPLGAFLACVSGDTIRIIFRGETMVVKAPGIKVHELKKGQKLRLNEFMNVVEVFSEYEEIGEQVALHAFLPDSRALVSTRTDEKVVAYFSEALAPSALKIGDSLLMTRSRFLVEKLPQSEVEDLVLEETTGVSYEQIGGLGRQVEEIRDALEMPYLYPEKFKEYKIRPAKGLLLYGPPGCGKTMIAKAVVDSIAKRAREKTGKELKGYFINVRGPELLTKWVGDTEMKIREVFKKAQEKADENNPVGIFFDEIDSLFPMRGSGVSSDVEKTTVAQFCTMLDGLVSLKNVFVIGATNRQDLIDPAILRPGRLDIKVKIGRPDEKAARDILRKYLTPDLPLHRQYFDEANYEGDDYTPKDRNGNPRFQGNEKVKYRLAKNPAKIVEDYLIPLAVRRIYDREKKENHFLEITYASGGKELMYLKDFMSGAIIESVVMRAKKFALKREILAVEKETGVRLRDIYDAIEQEFKENQDLPNTMAGVEEWLRISGKRGERVANVRSLIESEKSEEPKKNVEPVNPTGHYL